MVFVTKKRRKMRELCVCGILGATERHKSPLAHIPRQQKLEVGIFQRMCVLDECVARALRQIKSNFLFIISFFFSKSLSFSCRDVINKSLCYA